MSPYRALPSVLAQVLGPVLRLRDGDPAFLDRFTRTHEQAMLSMPDEHWEGIIHTFGLAGAGELLDVACGAGAWLAPLAGTNTRVVGVDIDDGLLDLARERCAGVANIEIRQMSAESLDVPDDSFDAVTCFTALPYLDQDVAIAEMGRVLRPGGRLVVGTVGSGYYAKHVTEGIRAGNVEAIRYGLDPVVVAAAKSVTGGRAAAGSLRSWSPRAVRRLLGGHGFKVDRTIRSVEAVDPSWPERYLARPFYTITFATR